MYCFVVQIHSWGPIKNNKTYRLFTLLDSLIPGFNRFTNFDTSPEADTNWPSQLGLPGVNGGLFPPIDFTTNGYAIVGRPEEGNHVRTRIKF